MALFGALIKPDGQRGSEQDRRRRDRVACTQARAFGPLRENRRQIVHHVRRGLIPLSRILLKRARHNRTNFRGKAWPKIAQRRWIVLDHSLHDLRLADAGKWRAPRQHLVENRPEAPQVRPEIDRLSGGLFRGHVEWRAPRRAVHGSRDISGPCQPEIDDSGNAVICHDHVARLDIPMANAVFVGLGQPRCDLASNLKSFFDRQPGGDLFAKRNTLVERHRDEQTSGFFNRVDHYDIGVIQRRGGASFFHELPLQRGVMLHVERQEFQGDRPVELGVKSLVHDSHSASAKQCQNLVVGDGLAGQSPVGFQRSAGDGQIFQQPRRRAVQNLPVRILGQESFHLAAQFGIGTLQHDRTALAC